MFIPARELFLILSIVLGFGLFCIFAGILVGRSSKP